MIQGRRTGKFEGCTPTPMLPSGHARASDAKKKYVEDVGDHEGTGK